VFNNSDLSAATALSSATPTQIGSGTPGVNFRIWWDGDLLSEILDKNQITKWAYPSMPGGGFSSVTFDGIYGARNAAPLYGDMFGDWREEVLLEQSGNKTMRIYTTTISTDQRIYCLMHDPEYRNSMTEKGYMQSHMVDYYLGDGMTDPPKPNITYPGGVSVVPDTRRTGRVLASSEGANMMVMAGKSFTLHGVSFKSPCSISVYTSSGELVARGTVSENKVNLRKQFGLSNSMFVVKIDHAGAI
jgi:hypothetical protein